jgi:arsenate reductase
LTVTIYHNPACGTSRNTLAMIREKVGEPEIVEYLKTPPSRQRLVELLAAMKMKPRELVRQKGSLYEELGLADPKWTDDELIDFMIAHPMLIERPIVVTDKGARLCRPAEKVLEILP